MRTICGDGQLAGEFIEVDGIDGVVRRRHKGLVLAVDHVVDEGVFDVRLPVITQIAPEPVVAEIEESNHASLVDTERPIFFGDALFDVSDQALDVDPVFVLVGVAQFGELEFELAREFFE